MMWEVLPLTKQKSANGPSRDAKRDRFQGEEKTTVKSKRWMIFSIVGLIVVVAGAAVGMRLMLRSGGPGDVPLSSSASSTSSTSDSTSYAAATNGHAPYPLIEADTSGVVQLPAKTFEDYAAHYYTYMHNGQPIEFFVLKSEDGVVRAAFNACDVCYSALQGYSQNGQIMICNNCGRQFPADQINIVQGGCNPSPLDRSVEGDYLVIDVDDIIRGAGYF